MDNISSHEVKLPHIYTHNNDDVNDDNDNENDNEDTTNRIHNDIKHIIYNRTQVDGVNSNSNSNGDVFLTDKIKEPIITIKEDNIGTAQLIFEYCSCFWKLCKLLNSSSFL